MNYVGNKKRKGLEEGFRETARMSFKRLKGKEGQWGPGKKRLSKPNTPWGQKGGGRHGDCCILHWKPRENTTSGKGPTKMPGTWEEWIKKHLGCLGEIVKGRKKPLSLSRMY